MNRDYRTYLRSIGCRPIRGNLRTLKQEGDLEIVFHPQSKDWRTYRHGVGFEGEEIA